MADYSGDSYLKQISSADSSGTYTYTDAGGEQDVVELTTSTRVVVQGIWLDLNTMTQSGEIKVYHKIDGTNYREIAEYYYENGVDSVGVYIALNCGITEDLKVTYEEEGGDEGDDRDILYSIVYEDKE